MWNVIDRVTNVPDRDEYLFTAEPDCSTLSGMLPPVEVDAPRDA